MDGVLIFYNKKRKEKNVQCLVSENNLLTQVLRALCKNYLASSIINHFSKMGNGSTVDFCQERRIKILYFPMKYSNNYSSTIFFHQLVCMPGFYILCMLCGLLKIKKNLINNF